MDACSLILVVIGVHDYFCTPTMKVVASMEESAASNMPYGYDVSRRERGDPIIGTTINPYRVSLFCVPLFRAVYRS